VQVAAAVSDPPVAGRQRRQPRHGHRGRKTRRRWGRLHRALLPSPREIPGRYFLPAASASRRHRRALRPARGQPQVPQRGGGRGRRGGGRGGAPAAVRAGGGARGRRGGGQAAAVARGRAGQAQAQGAVRRAEVPPEVRFLPDQFVRHLVLICLYVHF
jgi:hypothetical protein